MDVLRRVGVHLKTGIEGAEGSVRYVEMLKDFGRGWRKDHLTAIEAARGKILVKAGAARTA
jgi:hypothetical protein